jgi:type VI secretion system protein ImpL
MAQWREYFRNSRVVPYGSVGDAAAKLNQLSSNQSYLLALFCVASVNTNVASDTARAPYQPVQFVEPPPCQERYVQSANSPYVSALTNLQSAMDRLAKAPNMPEDLANATLNEATNAYRATRQIAQSFRIDREGNVHAMVQDLMEQPIKYAEGVVGRIGPAQINAGGKRLCADFGGLSRKYPFNTGSSTDATLEEIDTLFRPGDGKLAQFYETSLKNHLDRAGNAYVRKADANVRITDGFLRFFNRASAFSQALYHGGSRDARLTYAMKALAAEGLRGVSLTLDGQTLSASGQGGDWKEFSWPGTSARGARLAGNLGGGELGFIQYDGLWAAFRFFGDADRFEMTGSNYTLQWVPRQGQSGQPIRLENGRSLVLPFMLDLKGAPPVFQKGYLAGMECTSDVAR